MRLAPHFNDELQKLRVALRVVDEDVEDTSNALSVFVTEIVKVGAVAVIEREDENINFLFMERVGDFLDKFGGKGRHRVDRYWKKILFLPSPLALRRA